MVIKFIKSLFIKTRTYLGEKIKNIFSKSIDDETLEDLERALYESDLGSKVSRSLVEDIQAEFGKKASTEPEEILTYIKDSIKKRLLQHPPTLKLDRKLTVILVVGVNGNGKTTSSAKLAHHYHKQGKKVILAAADTFRAAATEQLETWSKKIGVELVKGQLGSDPAAVAFDSLSAAMTRDADVLIIDTAGRLQTKTHLMGELEKINRVLKKQLEEAPHETLLVIDATVGQNAIEQAQVFDEYTPLSGLILTKLDGTAKGGVVVAIQNELNIPIKYVGTGEGVEDFKAFDANTFVNELFY